MLTTRLTNPKAIRAAAEFETKLFAVHGDRIKLDPDAEYLGSQKPIDVVCSVCDYPWSPRATDLLQGYGCPACQAQKQRDSWGKKRCTPGTEAEKQKARDMYASGMTLKAVADELGRSIGSISNWCNPDVAEKNRLRSAAHRAANPEAARASTRRYRQQTPHGRAGKRAHDARRRGYKNDWYTNCPNDISREQAVYLECERLNRETGELHHVDHIWPLSQGGAHLWFNLQIITAEENLSKNDNYRPEDVELYRQRIADLFNQP